VTRPTQLESAEAGPYWEATRARRLVLPWCTSCDRPFWYPRAACPGCLGTDIEWREATGRGTVYAVSVQHNAALPEFKDQVPYAVALVELDEGVRFMSNIVTSDPTDVAVGQRVRLSWEPIDDGRALAVFEAEEEESSGTDL
jgi:uncharacterized OB-fold protein